MLMSISTGIVQCGISIQIFHVYSGTCSQELQVEFPHFGPITVWNMGHSEPETVPRFLPGVKTVTLKGGLSEQPLNNLAIWLARSISRQSVSGN